MAFKIQDVISNREWEKILEAEDPTVATVIFDFAMKFIPKFAKETTTQWFGKRGISWQLGKDSSTPGHIAQADF